MADNFKEFLNEDKKLAEGFEKAYDAFEDAIDDVLMEVDMRIEDGEKNLEGKYRLLEKAQDQIQKGYNLFRKWAHKIPKE